MGTERINKLRQRFIVAAMLSFSIIILLVGLGINFTVVGLNRAQIKKTLDHIINTESTNKLDGSRQELNDPSTLPVP